MQAIDVSLGQQVSPLEPSQEKPADLLPSTVHMKSPFDHTISSMSCAVRALAVLSPQMAMRDCKNGKRTAEMWKIRGQDKSRRVASWCIGPRDAAAVARHRAGY